MDTLTHALSGALLARATAPADSADGIPLRRRVVLGSLAAAFPDIDVVASWMSPLAYLYHHRGITHSWVMLALWAVVLAWLCTKVWRNGPGWKAYAGVIAWGIAVHIAGDWMTSFGTMMFAPLSNARLGIGTTFIIDLWFSGIIIAGLLVCLMWRASRIPAVTGLFVLCGYVVFQYAQMREAVAFGEQYARAANIQAVTVIALPRPMSPFHWMVMVEEADRYHYALVSLTRKEAPQPLPPDAGFFARVGAPYLPLPRAQWVPVPRWGGDTDRALATEAMAQPAFEFFRWFAQYPVLHRIDIGKGESCVWFQDLRFFTPGRAAWPFRYGMCRDAGMQWRAYELLGDNMKTMVY